MTSRDWDDPAVEDAVACSLLRWGADTRAARAYREIRAACPEAALVDRLAVSLGLGADGSAARAATARARLVLEHAAARNLLPLVFGRPGYPAALTTIVDPPIVLWTAGRREALEADAVAVVGSRRASTASLLLARRLAKDLAAAGVGVISGLAKGIDAASHEGALDGAGPTVAVLGSGADVIYPRQHRALAGRIRDHGCLVSELPPGTGPLPRHFPLRNRIISGLAAAVVVVEAAERSGSLITARAALDQGRDVLAVPGAVVSGCHRGCHALIKDGAGLVETAEDVLAAVGWARSSIIRPSRDVAGLVARMVVGQPATVDEIAASDGRPVPAVLAELSRLELAGTVTRTSDGQFVRLD